MTHHRLEVRVNEAELALVRSLQTTLSSPFRPMSISDVVRHGLAALSERAAAQGAA